MFKEVSSERRCWFKTNSLVVQWLRLCAPNAGGYWFDPKPENKILQATTKTQYYQNKLKMP